MRTLLEQHVPPVYRFALRLTGDPRQAEDLAQETMLRAWKHRGRLRDGTDARPWLFRITVNLWRDELRRQRVRRSTGIAHPHVLRSADARPDRAAAVREDLERVLAAFDELPPRQREVVHLVACESLGIDDVAEVLGITPNAVKASLSLARRRLREVVQSERSASSSVA
ncbi:MAG: RNA polymerase sigma factor [Planctomycetota bacterium]